MKEKTCCLMWLTLLIVENIRTALLPRRIPGLGSFTCTHSFSVVQSPTSPAMALQFVYKWKKTARATAGALGPAWGSAHRPPRKGYLFLIGLGRRVPFSELHKVATQAKRDVPLCEKTQDQPASLWRLPWSDHGALRTPDGRDHKRLPVLRERGLSCGPASFSSTVPTAVRLWPQARGPTCIATQGT